MVLSESRLAARALDRLAARHAGDLLPLTDMALLAAAGAVGPVLDAAAWSAAPAVRELAWVTALLAPFLLYDPDFARRAMAGCWMEIARDFALRYALLCGCIVAIAFAARWLEPPYAAVHRWAAAALLLTAASRGVLAAALARGSKARHRAAMPAARIGDGIVVTVLADRPLGRWSALLKSAFDRGAAALLVLLLLPVLALIALAVRLDSPGPVLFRQRRHGLNNAEFDIYKFRTMRSAPAGAALEQTRREDARVTRTGRFLRKWSLDELPQIFNVLEGSMSLVGPRPHAVNMRTQQRLGPEIDEAYPHRHRVRPGITGWSQVNGARGATHTVEQLRRRIGLDLYYIEHWSPLLDLKILTRTVRVVLGASDAY